MIAIERANTSEETKKTLLLLFYIFYVVWDSTLCIIMQVYMNRIFSLCFHKSLARKENVTVQKKLYEIDSGS